MTDISSWRQTLEPSGRPLDPEGIATIIFGHTIRIFAELTNDEEHISLEPAILEALNEQKDRYKLWGSNFNAQSGGLDKFLDGAGRMREALLPILCRIAEATVAIARQSNLPEALEAVFQQIEEIKKQAGDIGTGKPASFEDDDDDERMGRLEDLAQTLTIDDFSSSESEDSSNEDVSAVAEALKDIEFLNDLLYNLGPALYDNAERMASKQRDSSIDVNKGQVTMQVWYTNSILSAYPSIEIVLARRLGEAMESRVHRLEEARTQAHKQSSESDSESTSDDSDDVGEIPTTSSQVVMSQASSEYTAPSTEVSSMFDSQPTKVVKKKNYASKSVASATSFAPSLIDESISSQKRGIPKIPNDNGMLKAFDCTLCGSRLTSVFNTISWVFVNILMNPRQISDAKQETCISRSTAICLYIRVLRIGIKNVHVPA
ncbi:MAG: hypothetical protein HETSPECPRED_000422 [Heterodermia speciosa]|uniref:Uncharacterized protein n=1 Tax=Heterodermia speciosa TaxID=116794 RepID=A0A8H3ID74_9LECA|nr:MAG: hypothetical protein HETSPECPRED_000422 [Heterodermia speciosa]